MTSFKQYLEGKGFSKSSIVSIQKGVHLYLNWLELEKIEAENSSYSDLLSYIQSLQKRGIKQLTIQLYLNNLKHYFNWFVSEGIMVTNPTREVDIKGIKRRSLYKTLNREELEELYNVFKERDGISQRNKAIVGLMIYQGLGTSELSKLREKDLQLREGKVQVLGGRRSNARELKLESVQVLDLMEYLLQGRKDILLESKEESEKLFVSRGGSKQFNNVMSGVMKALRKCEGVESSNQIRTSVIVGWLKSYNLREVQYMAGHRFLSSTEAYLVNDLEDLEEGISKYHPF